MHILKKSNQALIFVLKNLNRIWLDLINTQLFKLSFYFLPITILLLNLLLHVLITLKIASLNYDEFVLLAISKQPLIEFFNTTQVEPHPLGFYFLLRFFNWLQLSADQISLALTIMFHTILIWATLLAYKTKVIEKFNLKLGLSLLFSSMIVFEIGYQIKQDVISFPFFILLLFSLLGISVSQRWKTQVLCFATLLLSSIIITMFSYIYLLFSVMVVLICLCYQILKAKNTAAMISFLTLTVVMIVAGAYYFSFGHYQIANNYLNSNRFLWTKDISPSFISRLPEITSGTRFFDQLSDLFIIAFFILVGIALYDQKEVKNSKSYLITALFFSVTLVSYVLRLFVQSRYALPAFLFFYLLCGLQSHKKAKYFLCIVILIVLYVRTATIFTSTSDNTLAFQTLSKSLHMALDDEKTGVISNVPGISLYLKVRFLSDSSQAFPISTSKNTSVIPTYSFNRQHFEESSEILEKSPAQLEKEFRTLGFRKIIYIDSKNIAYAYYDPEKRIKAALSQYCSVMTEGDHFTDVDVYIFSQCQ